MFIESSPETPRAFTETLVEQGISTGTARAYIDILQEKGTDEEIALGEAMHNANENPSDAQKIAVIRAGFKAAGLKDSEAGLQALAAALSFQDGLPNCLNIKRGIDVPDNHLKSLFTAFPYIDSINSECCGRLQTIAAHCKDLPIQPRIRHVRVHRSTALWNSTDYDSDSDTDRMALTTAPIFKHLCRLHLHDRSRHRITSPPYQLHQLTNLESLSETTSFDQGKIAARRLEELQLPHLHTLKGIHIDSRASLMRFLRSDAFHKLKSIAIHNSDNPSGRQAVDTMRLLLQGRNIRDIAIDYFAFIDIGPHCHHGITELPKDQRKHITFLNPNSPHVHAISHLPWLSQVANELTFTDKLHPTAAIDLATSFSNVRLYVTVSDIAGAETTKLAERTIKSHNDAIEHGR